MEAEAGQEQEQDNCRQRHEEAENVILQKTFFERHGKNLYACTGEIFPNDRRSRQTACCLLKGVLKGEKSH